MKNLPKYLKNTPERKCKNCRHWRQKSDHYGICDHEEWGVRAALDFNAILSMIERLPSTKMQKANLAIMLENNIRTLDVFGCNQFEPKQ